MAGPLSGRTTGSQRVSDSSTHGERKKKWASYPIQMNEEGKKNYAHSKQQLLKQKEGHSQHIRNIPNTTFHQAPLLPCLHPEYSSYTAYISGAATSHDTLHSTGAHDTLWTPHHLLQNRHPHSGSVHLSIN